MIHDIESICIHCKQTVYWNGSIWVHVYGINDDHVPITKISEMLELINQLKDA